MTLISKITVYVFIRLVEKQVRWEM